jgi:steroid delta-isomerase-like uncharacterized protein
VSHASVDVARGFIHAHSQANWDRVGELVAPDSVYEEFGTGRRAKGDEITELFKGWKRAMPDTEGTVTNAIDGGDTVVLEVTWTGTLTGPLATPEGEIEPTGKHQTTRGCMIFTFEGERISQFRQYFDTMDLLQQLGLLPAPASA